MSRKRWIASCVLPILHTRSAELRWKMILARSAFAANEETLLLCSCGQLYIGLLLRLNVFAAPRENERIVITEPRKRRVESIDE